MHVEQMIVRIVIQNQSAEILKLRRECDAGGSLATTCHSSSHKSVELPSLPAKSWREQVHVSQEPPHLQMEIPSGNI